MDLYYDPVVDEHVGHGPMGVVIPAWYFAPQKRELAQAGWQMAAGLSGALGNGPITGLEDPARATMLLQIAGEFASPDIKQRFWEAAEPHIEPTWDRESGEFTLGFGLGEAHPRGQWNARTMAGWVCTEGAWSRLFNEPNLRKFDEPTVEGVDFPRIALSEARWDGSVLHLAAHPQRPSVTGSRTKVRIGNLGGIQDWILISADKERIPLRSSNGYLEVELVADNRKVQLSSSSSTAAATRLTGSR